MKNISRVFKRTDILLLFICVTISAISIFLLYLMSSSLFINKRLFIVQLIASILGLLFAILISSVDYHTISKLWKFYVPISVILVILTFFIGTQRGNADDKAWIMLPLGLSIQPAEFLKICFIITFSLHLSLVKNNINTLKNISLLLLHAIVPIILIHLQGDDGTCLMFIMIFIVMLFSAGISWKYIIISIISVVLLSPCVWYLLNEDQRNRILIMFHPESDQYGIGYQQFRGLISIGNGGFVGQGIANNNYELVPEMQNDFIFSFLSQILGYAGSILILLLFLILFLRILLISLKCNDLLGKFICIGVFAMLASQTIFNIGMNLSILPVIGITLPLMSSGGSSIITTYLGTGLVLSVYTYNNNTLFYKYKI